MLFNDLQDGLNEIIISFIYKNNNAREDGEWCFSVRLWVLGRQHCGVVLLCTG